MKKSTGMFVALVAAVAGAAGTIFALKRKKELDQYAYDDFEEDFFDCDDIEDEICECDCDDCECNEEIPYEDVSEEEELDTMEEEIEDNDQPRSSDF